MGEKMGQPNFSLFYTTSQFKALEKHINDALTMRIMARITKHKPSKGLKRNERKVKKGIRKEIWMTILIAGVMVLSVFGIIFSSYRGQQKEDTYNGYKFVSTQQGWMTHIDDQKVYFNYAPTQLEDLNVSPAVFSLLDSPVIVITFDPLSEQIDEVEAARLTLAQSFTIQMGKAIIYGVTQESSEYNLSEYHCANATSTLPVIELRSVDESGIPEGDNIEKGTSIYSEGACVIVASRQRDWMAASERLIYGMLNIIE